MHPFLLLNLLLALLWMLLWGLFDIWSLMGGMVIGWLLLSMVSRTTDYARGYGTRVFRILSFTVYFVRILIKANLQVAWEVLTPTMRMTPRFIQYPLAGMSPLQITTLANAITLTPGTLSVDITPDSQWLLVHCMYAADRDSAIGELDELKDRMLKEVFQ